MGALRKSHELIGGRYQILDQIGVGGMGTVYHAFDRLDSQPVALKQVSTETEDTPLNTKEFNFALANEFRILASLRHPNIISVIDYGFDDGDNPYFVMDLLDHAEPITVASKRKPIEQRIDYVIQMLQALAYLHRRGIIHRDLKPANVLVQNKQVKVLDFGLSTTADIALRKSSDENVAGTLAYLAPEIIEGRSASVASDLYAVGIILYEVLTGEHPFDTSKISQLFQDILTTVPNVTPIDEIWRELTTTAESMQNNDGQESLGTRVFSTEEIQQHRENALPAAQEAPLTPASDGILSLGDVVLSLLAKNPQNRMPNADGTIEALSMAIDKPVPIENKDIRESYLQSARFVGRDEEFDTLIRALRQAKNGRGGVWLIGGESGVGKSRVIQEMRIQALIQKVQVINGQGISDGGLTYQLWRDPVRRLVLTTDLSDQEAGLLKKHLIPDIDQLLEKEVEEPDDIDNEQSVLMTLVADMFNRQEKPTLLVLEDLQWTHESLDMLKAVQPITQNNKLLILGTYRDDERPDIPEQLPDAQILKLERLNENSIAELSASMLGDVGGNRNVVELLQSETEGNVFFLIEVIRALAEEAGDLKNIAMMTLPQSVFAGGVKRILERRLSSVPKAHQRLLKIAAVAGRYVNREMMTVIAPDMDMDQWAMDCANAAILEVKEKNWRFAHDKLREVLLETISDIERPGLHAQVAQAIEILHPDDDNFAQSLAIHWGQAGAENKECHYSIIAGHQAQRVANYRSAQQFFERSLELVPDTPENSRMRSELAYWLSESIASSSTYQEIIEMYQKNLGEAEAQNDKIGIANALRGMGWVLYRQGHNEQAIEYLEKCLPMFQELKDRRGEGEAVSNLGSAYRKLGELQKASEYYHTALKIAREVNASEGEAAVLTNLSNVHSDMNEIDTSFDFAQQAREVSSQFDDRYFSLISHQELGRLHTLMSDYAPARRNLDFALKVSRDINYQVGEGEILGLQGNVFREMGQYDLALERYQAGITSAHFTQAYDVEAQIMLDVAFIYLQNDDYSAAQMTIKQALQPIQESARPALRIQQDYQLALWHYYQQDFKTALVHVEKAMQYRAPRYDHDVQTLKGLIHIMLEENDTAYPILEKALAEVDGVLAKSPRYTHFTYLRALILGGLAILDLEMLDKTYKLQAEEAFKTALDMGPSFLEVQFAAKILNVLDYAVLRSCQDILIQAYVIRSYRQEDIPQLVDIMNADYLHNQSDQLITTRELTHKLQAPNINPETNMWVATTLQSKLVGYIQYEPDGNLMKASGIIHPDHRGHGLAHRLIQYSERQLADEVEAICFRVLDSREDIIHLLEAENYQRIRANLIMRRQLNTHLELPELPEGYSLRPFNRERDAYACYQLEQTVFRDQWGHKPIRFDYWTHHLLDAETSRPALWVLILKDEEVVGLAVNSVFHHEVEYGYIFVVAVDEAHRGKGLGQVLMLNSFSKFRNQNYPYTELNVDEENPTGAVELYKKVGMTVKRRYLLYEKKLGTSSSVES